MMFFLVLFFLLFSTKICFFGFRIQVLMNNLWFGMNMKDAVQQPRIHSQLIPDAVFSETRMPKDIILKLKKIGHKVNMFSKTITVKIQ